MRGKLFLLTLAECGRWAAGDRRFLGHWVVTDCVAREGYVEADLLCVARPYAVTSCALFCNPWMALDVHTVLCKPYSRVEIPLTWHGMDTPHYQELVTPSVTQAEMDDTRVDLLDLHSHLR